MELFVINERMVYDIINSLTLTERAKDILCKIIKKYKYSYTSFIYSLFKYYSKYYFNVYSEYLFIDTRDIENCIRKADPQNKINICMDNVLVVNVADINFYRETTTETRFNDHLYNDINEQMDDYLYHSNNQDDIEYIDEIYDAIDDVFTIIETNVFYKFIDYKNENLYIIIYLKLLEDVLEIYVMNTWVNEF